MQRNIAQLTWPEVQALDLTSQGALVLPIGAIEQHGPHLSTDCDLHFAETLLNMALDQLAPETKVWRLPVLPISKSNEHKGFPGTWYLSAQTFMAVLRDIAQCAVENGFRRLVLWNCHGGNRALLEVAARDIRVETGLMTFQVFASGAMPDPLEPLGPARAGLRHSRGRMGNQHDAGPRPRPSARGQAELRVSRLHLGDIGAGAHGRDDRLDLGGFPDLGHLGRRDGGDGGTGPGSGLARWSIGLPAS